MTTSLSWVEINTEALRENIASFRKILPLEVRFLTVVKGNAYGHGLAQVVPIIKNQVDWFGVNNLDEALMLKGLEVKKPILVLGYTPVSRLAEVFKNGFRQVVYDRETAWYIRSLKPPRGRIKVHLKIETGTNRQGVENRELLEIAQILKEGGVAPEGAYTQRIEIEGAYTHLSNVEESEAFTFARKQIKRFENQLDLLKESHVSIPIKHTASTAAAILYPRSYFNMVRVGIGLYGLWPSPLARELAKKLKIKLHLKPVLSWKTKVVQIKKVEKGETIGYGRTYKAKKDMRIAILPTGYFDGYDRGLSNVGRVLIGGKFAPVVGRVMMNMIAIDITKIGRVSLEDEVVLIGRQGRNEISADEIARKIGTINYEVVTRLSPILARVIT